MQRVLRRATLLVAGLLAMTGGTARAAVVDAKVPFPFAVQGQQSKHASKPAAATHATRGVVKSIDDETLVVTQSSGKHAEMTFALNPSTHRTGTIAAGTAVTIRYREEGKTNVATAIRVESARQPGAHTTPSKR